ncbi:MAG: PepSY domain-containing protein [Burkholderiales bacterium]
MTHYALNIVRNPRFISLVMAATLFGGAGAAHAYTGKTLSHNAKVSMTKARAIALKAHPGKITGEELEKESGGSGLRYSFDIRHGKATYEVGVDAQTGLVLENKAQGPNSD